MNPSFTINFKSNNIDYGLINAKKLQEYLIKMAKFNYNELLEIENSLLDWEKIKILMHLNYSKRKKYDQATKINETLKISPLSIESLYIKSLLLMEMNDNQRSLKLLEKIISLGCQDASVYNQQGIALISINEPKKAIISFQNAIDLDPSNIVNYKFDLKPF